MAELNFDKDCSTFYPPRARWYSPVLNLGNTLGRRMPWNSFRIPKDMGFGALLAALLVPGLGVLLSGRKRLGWGALALSLFLMLAFVVWLGYPAGNFAFGWLISIHTSSIGCFCAPLLGDNSMRRRLLFTVATLLAISLFIYWPARDFVSDHLLLPLRVHGNVVVLRRIVAPRSVHRGDWVGYKIHTSNRGMAHGGHGEVVVESGMGLGPVLAMPGDKVEFSPEALLVNGVAQPRTPDMPVEGGLVVPEKQWLIWPRMFVANRNVAMAVISQAALETALVPWEELVGKPFHRWLWRKQILL